MPRKITKKQKANATKEYIHSQKSLKVVANEFGISVETLRKSVGPKLMKIRGRKKLVENPVLVNHNVTWTEQDRETLKNLILEGKSNKEIAAIMGRTPNSISFYKNYIKKLQMPSTLGPVEKLPIEIEVKIADKKVKKVKKVRTVLKPNGEQAQVIKLSDLAEIVQSHNVVVSIVGNEITIRK